MTIPLVRPARFQKSLERAGSNHGSNWCHRFAGSGHYEEVDDLQDINNFHVVCVSLCGTVLALALIAAHLGSDS